MKLPTLYSRRSDGKVQELTLEVVDNKYRVHSGIKDGRIVTSEWTECQGKNIGRANETTPEQQAMLEARAKWDKKKAEKYSESIDTMDAECVFKPMLAKTFEDYEHKLFEDNGRVKVRLYTNPKLDGIRCIATKDGLFSRTGKPFYGIPHIQEQLAPLFISNPSLILDGELYNHDLKEDFNKICSCVKKLKPTKDDLKVAKELIQYWVYDVPSDLNESYYHRIYDFAGLLVEQTEEFRNNSDDILVIFPDHVGDKEQLIERYESYISDGYEGMMVKQNGVYQNKRSELILKYKSFVDEEFEILDITEGVGNRSGMAGFMTFERNGEEFRSNIKGDRDYLRELLNNKNNYIGRQATVKYFNLTPAPRQVPRFPVVVKVDRNSYE